MSTYIIIFLLGATFGWIYMALWSHYHYKVSWVISVMQLIELLGMSSILAVIVGLLFFNL